MVKEVSTNEILDFLQEHMVTKAELRIELNKQKLEILDHVDDKLADLEGSVVVRQRQQENKVNKILDLLERHKLAPVEEIRAIKQISVFPSFPKTRCVPSTLRQKHST